jgi:hypothetical protein
MYSSHAQSSHQLVGIGEIRPHQSVIVVGREHTDDAAEQNRNTRGTVSVLSKAMIFSEDHKFSKALRQEDNLICNVRYSQNMWKMISPRPLREVSRVQLCMDPGVTTQLLPTLCTLNVPINVHVPQRHNDRAVPPNKPLIKSMTVYYQLNKIK